MSRDREIIRSLEKLRVMRRDDIAELFFPGIKNKVTQTNRTLLRLRRDGYITCSPEFQHQYVYFPIPHIKKNSQKIPHFLEILDVYKAMRKVVEPKEFVVEPKLGEKGTIEPDIFTIWKKTPIFIEIQRNIYSDTVMARKMAKYKTFIHKGEWMQLPWQPEGKKIFPLVLMVTDHKYRTGELPFRFTQVKSIHEFIEKVTNPK